MSGLIAACCRSRSTSAFSRACSSSQRRFSSSKRANRSLPRLVVRSEAAAVHPHVRPRRARLHAHDLLGGPGQQLPVVGDEEHRLTGLLQPLLQPPLAGHVQIVVRLVEQQHLVGPAQQRLQHQPLLLAAAQRPHLPPLRLLVRHAERGHRAHVPERLGLVPPRLRPVAQRLRVRHLRGLVVDRHDQVLGGVHRRAPPPGSAAGPPTPAGPVRSARPVRSRRTAASRRARR